MHWIIYHLNDLFSYKETMLFAVRFKGIYQIAYILSNVYFIAI
ncbi:hypothetical protein KsCSTR_32840 [Candidatus Kuenenia stuttgartiensis]|nr:hypothetical protein KsCSTR_32840 [Candidatus Kuenenia stuttgartiensis]